jgi:hypothetical protein
MRQAIPILATIALVVVVAAVAALAPKETPPASSLSSASDIQRGISLP